METEYKYFIEHKELRTWLAYDGELTNDPNKCLSFSERWRAESWLEAQEPRITSDYSGMHSTIDYSFVHLHEDFKRRVAESNNGANLYEDFIITEHQFF